LAATSDIRASAPSRRLPPSRLIVDHPGLSELMSTTADGRITSSFIRSISVVPPASGWIAASVSGALSTIAAARTRTADDASVAL
jgi:hypothetical protein